VRLDVDMLSSNISLDLETECPVLNLAESCLDERLWSMKTSYIVKYLTLKGSKVDKTIKWSSWSSCDPSKANLCDDRKLCKRSLEPTREIPACAKIRRCVSMVCDSPQETDITQANVRQMEVHDDPLSMLGDSGHRLTANQHLSLPDDLFDDSQYKPQIRPFNSLSRSSSFSHSGSIRITTQIAPKVTILFIDIQGFTAHCAAMPAGHVGEWVAAFYELVDAAAAAQGVTRVESRGDCCVCVAGAAGAAPGAPPSVNAVAGEAAPASVDGAADQATRMLAFAAALHAKVAALPVGGVESGGRTAVRMGMATGEAIFYASSGGSDTAPFASVQGAAAAAAAKMEGLAAPGLARVHRSTADKWAAETRRAPPATARVEGAGRAAVFDCAARAFCADAAGRGVPERRRGHRQRRMSAPF
jgi:class 3 adenylate cyclase